MNYSTELYEKLRSDVVGKETCGRYGMAAFLKNGLAGWLRIVNFEDDKTHKSTSYGSPEQGNKFVSNPSQMVDLLASLFLSHFSLGYKF